MNKKIQRKILLKNCITKDVSSNRDFIKYFSIKTKNDQECNELYKKFLFLNVKRNKGKELTANLCFELYNDKFSKLLTEDKIIIEYYDVIDGDIVLTHGEIDQRKLFYFSDLVTDFPFLNDISDSIDKEHLIDLNVISHLINRKQ